MEIMQIADCPQSAIPVAWVNGSAGQGPAQSQSGTLGVLSGSKRITAPPGSDGRMTRSACGRYVQTTASADGG